MSNQHHPVTWILVANRSQAKIYRLVKFPQIEEISDLAHPEGRLHNQDLISSKPGRAFQSMGTGRSSYQAKSEPTQLEAAKFAAHVADHLASAGRKGDFHRLYVFAEPTFLGLLRDHINPEVQKTIVAESPKDFSSSDKAAIEHHLAGL